MNYITQYFNYLVRRYGGLNILGLFLMFASIVILLALSLPERHRLVYAKQQAMSMKHHVVKRQVTNVSAAPHVMINTFYQMLPVESEITNQLEKFFDIAFENNLYLDGVEYKFEEDKSAKLCRYHIILPVTGTYTEIRQFVKQLLEQAPNAALDNIALSREDVRDTDISAKLQITLYVRPKA